MCHQRIKKLLSVVLVACPALLGANHALAGPAVHWKSTNLNISHSKCVQRAPLAISMEIVVKKVEKKSNGALAWNDNTTIVVHCVATGKNKSKGIVFVTGFKKKHLSGTLTQVYSALRSGVFE